MTVSPSFHQLVGGKQQGRHNGCQHKRGQTTCASELVHRVAHVFSGMLCALDALVVRWVGRLYKTGHGVLSFISCTLAKNSASTCAVNES